MKKRIISLCIAVALAISMFAGCANKNDKKSAASSEQANAEKPVDWYLNLSWFSSKWGDDWVTQKIIKDTGFKVNVIVPPAGGENQKLTTMIASGTLPDLITLGWSDTNLNQMISAKMLTPLNKLADKYAPDFYKNADKDVLIWNTKDDGNVYGYNCYTTNPEAVKNDPNVFSNYDMWVRKDIYEAIGKPDMATTEGFLKALRDAKAKYPTVENGTLIPLGVKPFGADGDENGSLSLCRELMDFLAIPYQTSDGKIYDRYTDPEYLRWLKMFRQATQEKLIPPDDFADNGDKVCTNLQNGRYFCMIDQWTDYTGQIQTWYASNPDKAYIAIPGPKNISGAEPTLSAGSPNGWLTTVISATGKHQENAIKFMTYMLSPEATELQIAGIEGKTFTKQGDKYIITQEYKDMLAKNDVSSGVGQWAYFCTNPQSVDYIDNILPSTKLIRDWNKPYSFYNGAFEFVPFEANTPEAKNQVSLYSLWDKTLPSLLHAKSDADFDKIMSDYVAKRKTLGYDTVNAALQKQLDSNNAKIAKFAK
ncbi:MAG: extracellular solute-binding protein [Clostridiales bacterium]|nr:extracellular solute-binding protein [Clostridiales bacterium]